jgi:hypothetical protein
MDKKQAQAIIKETFETSFDKSRFIGFVKNLLNNIEGAPFTYRGNYIPDAYEQYINSLERIGKYNESEHKIDVLIVKLKKETSIERARTMQRNFIAWYLNGSRGDVLKDAALVAFVSPNEQDWRFSLVKMDYRFEEGKGGRLKVKEEFTPARRWSFLVGANEKSHTAQRQLVDIVADDENNPTLALLENAFNIETVTKEFFEEYRKLFLCVKETLDDVVGKDRKIKTDFETKGVNTVDFSKKLLGQIVFLYFLQKKGWFGVKRDADWGAGPKNFLRELFEEKHGMYKNFFNDILEPLFYEALARERDDDFYSRFNCKIPFLNGGLFDPIGNYDWVHTDILLPNELFSNTRRTKEGDIGDGILDIFNRYNFTVKEDEPLEKEVAIDPELLGKAYEKFNAIRPDNYAEYEKALKSGQSGAESKFNKQYGVYYTPREIVHYICQQSLINYLTIKLEGKVIKEDIETLIKYGEQVSENEATVEAKGRETSTYFYKLSESIRQNAKLVDEKLTNIKVCDPAIGSGAFPVGMMSEIVKVRNVLSVYIKDSNRMPYRFKRECIEKSLYGVDIDAGAVEIAKLRLWLSLVVDEEDIKQIKPLPNLDYKIVCGDSLLGVEKDLLNLHLFNELERLKPLLFDETSPKKKQEYKKQIDEIINQITKGHREFDFEVYFSEVFHEKKGFDVVIANPPYIGEKGHKEIFREVKKGPLGKFYLGKMDYFYFFFHLSLNIAGENSSIAFITTNYYPTAMGAKKLRQDFKERVIIKNLMNFNELKIFESALGQHNMITILQKGHDETALAQTCITQKQGLATAEVLQQILNSKDAETQYYKVAQKDLYDGDEYYIRLIGISFISDNPIQIILNKLKKQGSLLDIICNVKTGLRTGIDKSSIKDRGIFILNHTEYKNLHLDNCEVNLFKPFFKNSDIQKYRTNLKHTYWVIYIGRNSKINLYQNIRQHLLQFKHEIESARWKERIPWYALVRTREQKIFESPKIVVPHRSRINCFAYNDISWYASSDVYFITEKDKSVYLKYVLSLLNSKLYYLWLYHRGKRKGETLELYQKPLSEIPIKKISESQQQTFITLVDRILAITKDEDYLQNLAKQAKVKEYERQIDQTVYKLYGLIPEEIKIVENFKND